MTSLEYKVLKYLCSHSPCHVSDIAKALKKEESLIETQLHHLEKSKFVSPELTPYLKPQIFAMLHTGVYEITTEGKLACENHEDQQCSQRIKFIVPILISILIAIVSRFF